VAPEGTHFKIFIAQTSLFDPLVANPSSDAPTGSEIRNEFSELDMVFIFLCHQCGEPVAVEEPVQ
jgi:hypothetical protein